jgi:hypothetical protein
MNLWETTVVNVQKGYGRLMLFAATFSERMRAEINVVRLRMQIDEKRAAIRKEHEAVGRKLIEMQENDSLPASFELFFKNDEITGSLGKIVRHEKALDELIDDLQHESGSLKQETHQGEEERPA